MQIATEKITRAAPDHDLGTSVDRKHFLIRLCWLRRQTRWRLNKNAFPYQICAADHKEALATDLHSNARVRAREYTGSPVAQCCNPQRGTWKTVPSAQAVSTRGGSDKGLAWLTAKERILFCC